MDDSTLDDHLIKYVQKRQDFEWFAPFDPAPDQQRVNIALKPRAVTRGCPFEFITEQEADFECRSDRIWYQFYQESPDHDAQSKPTKPSNSSDQIVVPGNDNHGIMSRDDSLLNIALQKHIQSITSIEVACERTMDFTFEHQPSGGIEDLLGDGGTTDDERSTAVLRREVRLAELRQQCESAPYHDLSHEELQRAYDELDERFHDILDDMKTTLTQ